MGSRFFSHIRKFIKRIVFKFGCAFKGLFIALTTENSFKFHIFAAVSVITAAGILKFSSIDWIILIFAVTFVFVAELFNTAIEYMVKMFTSDYHQLAEKLLDISASAVLFASIAMAVVGGILFFPYLF